MLAREMKIYDKILVCNVSFKMYSTDNLFSMFNTMVSVPEYNPQCHIVKIFSS